ncbi:hypothetical protein C8R46DRAFT_1109012, partial [Mycena filopes]
MQSVLLNGLNPENPDLVETIYSVTYLDLFSASAGRGLLTIMNRIPAVLPRPTNHRLEVFVIMRRFLGWRHHPIRDCPTLLQEAEEHFRHFDDPVIQARFYIARGSYHQYHDDDRGSARRWYEEALRLSMASGDTKHHSDALDALGNIEWQNGDYAVGQKYAFQSQRLATTLGDLYREARGLRTEAMCWNTLGNYRAGLAACARAQELLALCGLSGGEMDFAVRNSQGEVHWAKTEYAEARAINEQFLRSISWEQEPFDHAITLYNVSSHDIYLGAPKTEIAGNIDKLRSMFATMEYARGATLCDLLAGDLHLREGDFVAAGRFLRRCVAASDGKDGEIITLSLGLLANAKRWRFSPSSDNWSIVFLLHMLKSGQQLPIHKALQLLGETFY